MNLKVNTKITNEDRIPIFFFCKIPFMKINRIFSYMYDTMYIYTYIIHISVDQFKERFICAQ